MDCKENDHDNIWMVRAGTDNELVDCFQNKSLVAIGWGEVGNLSQLESQEKIKQRCREVYSNKTTRQIGGCAGQLHRFVEVMTKGDFVVTYVQSDRVYLIGKVTGSYLWSPSIAPESYPHVRRVNWSHQIDRDEFGWFAKNTLGSSLTVFSLERIEEQILRSLSGKSIENNSISTSV